MMRMEMTGHNSNDESLGVTLRPSSDNTGCSYKPYLLLFVVQLGGQDRLHAEEVRGRAPRLRDGDEVGGLGDGEQLVLELGARQMEGGHGDAGQVLGLGLEKIFYKTLKNICMKTGAWAGQ